MTEQTTPVSSNPAPITIVMFEDKQCKGSVRYATADEKAPLQSVYVSRAWRSPMPKSVTVSIS